MGRAKDDSKTELRLLDVRIKLQNVARTMHEILMKMWAHKNVFFFIGSATLIHFFGDELAV